MFSIQCLGGGARSDDGGSGEGDELERGWHAKRTGGFPVSPSRGYKITF